MNGRTKTRVTLKDIAKKCGYATNTVSRALRNDPRLPAETREKIRVIAHDMGYIPNSIATTLRSGTSHIVAVIVNDIHNPHFSIMLGQMDAKLREAGYRMMILCTQVDEKLAKEMVQTAISMSVDGIIYFPYRGNHEHIEYMIKSNIPFVLIDRWIQGVVADTARCDDAQGGYLAGQHLLSLGHKRFVYLAGDETNSSQVDRQAGFLRALDASGIPDENVRIVPWEAINNAMAKNCMEELLLPPDYTAILAFFDEIAYYVLNMFHEKGVRVPEDVSLLSYDHIRSSTPYLAKLTSIGAAEGDVAHTAVQLLLNRMSDRSLPVQIKVLPVKIFDEGTTAPPASFE